MVKGKFDLLNLNRPVFFVTTELGWALGLEQILLDLHVICYEDDPLIDLVSDSCEVFSLKRERLDKKVPKNTGAMLKSEAVRSYIELNSGDDQAVVMFFKPQKNIDKYCKNNGWLKVGNGYELAKRFEDKVNLVNIAKPEWNLLPSNIKLVRELKWMGDLQVIQSARGWAGKNSFLVKNADDLVLLQNKLNVNQQVKVSSYVKGNTYLINGCIYKEHKLLSPIAKQVNCFDKQWGNSSLSTCGRSWSAVDLNEYQRNQVYEISKLVGDDLIDVGYRGYFGLDFLVDDQTGDVYLIEINPRLTASVGFYTQLQIEKGEFPLLGYHLAEYLGLDLEIVKASEVQGTQLVMRNTEGRGINIIRNFDSGFYDFSNGRWHFSKKRYEVNELKNNEIFVHFPSKGTKVGEGSELIRIEYLSLDTGVFELLDRWLKVVKKQLYPLA